VKRVSRLFSPFEQVRADNGKLAGCSSGSVNGKNFNKNNNTSSKNLLLVLAKAIIQNLQMVGVIFVFPERGRIM
jgi:hypothetical protein